MALKLSPLPLVPLLIPLPLLRSNCLNVPLCCATHSIILPSLLPRFDCWSLKRSSWIECLYAWSGSAGEYGYKYNTADKEKRFTRSRRCRGPGRGVPRKTGTCLCGEVWRRSPSRNFSARRECLPLRVLGAGLGQRAALCPAAWRRSTRWWLSSLNLRTWNRCVRSREVGLQYIHTHRVSNAVKKKNCWRNSGVFSIFSIHTYSNSSQ